MPGTESSRGNTVANNSKPEILWRAGSARDINRVTCQTGEIKDMSILKKRDVGILFPGKMHTLI